MYKIFLSFLFLIISAVHAEELTITKPESTKKNNKNLVRIYISTTGEEESIELKYSQLANVKVYLASFGDLLDKFMITMYDMEKNKVFGNQLSDADGVTTFRKVPPGHYSVYVNTRVKEDGELPNIKVADVVLSKF